MFRRFSNRIGKLQVSGDHRHLQFVDGTPFLYIGDTAWQLFNRLDRDEARYYLRDRAAKGFTVIQAVALAELGGIAVPNRNGDVPFIDGDPAKPNQTYYDYIDELLEFAEGLGLFFGFLPTWGAYWKNDGRNDIILTVENARTYGRFIGSRFRKRHVIWILGGDQNIETENDRAVNDELALGLREGDGGEHLITYHPRGPGRSAESLHKVEWLDFNMCQSSHGARDHDNGGFIERDLALDSPKPSLDGEPRYENLPVGFYYSNMSRLDRFDDYDVRQAAYWAMMAGACGHTYGHNSVWQMWTPNHTPAIWANIPWYDSLDAPGAFQMGYLRRLFEAFRFSDLLPASDFIVDGPQTGGAKVKALVSGDRRTALIYTPRGEAFTIDKQVFSCSRLREYWYDPRYGYSQYVHTTTNAAMQTYLPPTSGRGNDWILVLDDVSSPTPSFCHDIPKA